MVPIKPPTATVVGLTGATQTAAGPTFVPRTSRPLPGTLYAEVYVKATVSTLTLTGKWQISHDATNWFDCVAMNGAANVTLVTGTGSAVTRSLAVDAPSCAYGALYVRYAVSNAVASGSGLASDECSITYGYSH